MDDDRKKVSSASANACTEALTSWELYLKELARMSQLSQGAVAVPPILRNVLQNMRKLDSSTTDNPAVSPSCRTDQIGVSGQVHDNQHEKATSTGTCKAKGSMLDGDTCNISSKHSTSLITDNSIPRVPILHSQSQSETDTSIGLCEQVQQYFLGIEEGATPACNRVSSVIESDDEIDYDANYYDDSDEEFPQLENAATHPVLLCDISLMQRLFGEGSVKYIEYKRICEADVELHISLDFLAYATADAWGLKQNVPIVVRLNLSTTDYLDCCVAPKVDVLQVGVKPQPGICKQITSIVTRYLSEHWKNVNNVMVERYQCQATRVTALPPSPAIYSVDLSSLKRLTDMGFIYNSARNALAHSNGDVEDAVSMLVNSPMKCEHAPEQPAIIDKIHHTVKNISQKIFHKTEPSFNGIHLPESTTSISVSSLNDGFLAQLFQYVRERVLTLNAFCVVCDQPHTFGNDYMLKPAVCSRELCVFAYQTLGVMADVADHVATAAEVVDLLIAMASHACRSVRKEVIFDPYPCVVDPKNKKNLAINPNSKDYGYVTQIMNDFPSMSEIVSGNGPSLKTRMDAKNIVALPLLEWIIGSNRSHIVKLSHDKQLAFMNTHHQFLLRSSAPAKEAAFGKLKDKYGSVFCFHGSPIENWHSIIRNGLIVASGSKFQINGAAHGNGIYLSPMSATSFNYSSVDRSGRLPTIPSTKAHHEDRFLSNKGTIHCVALCEVVPIAIRKHADIWVVDDSDHVCTRFFFVYDSSNTVSCNVDLKQQSYTDQLHSVISQY